MIAVDRFRCSIHNIVLKNFMVSLSNHPFSSPVVEDDLL